MCNVSSQGATFVQLTPPVATVGNGEPPPVAFVVSTEPRAAVVRTGAAAPVVRLTTNSIPRATLTTSGLWIAMNVSITTPGDVADRWVVGAVTMLGDDALNWTVQSSNTVPWSVIAMRTPVGVSWLDASVSTIADKTLELVVTMLCDGAEILEVIVSVPAPGVPRVYAEQIETVGRSSQVASAVAGVSSGSALDWRMMATRSMVLCDADSAIGGGVIDFNVEICGVMGDASVVARSAIVSNLVLVAVAASAMLLLATLWAALAHTGILHSTAVLCMPASLFPAFVAVVPSTASSATLLLARLGASECAALDVVLGIVGLALSTLPATGFLILWALRANRWNALKRNRKALTTFHSLTGVLKRIVGRRWEWTTADGHRMGMERAWPVLLEYRGLRYGALDNIVLLGLSIMSVISGLSGSSAQCRGWSLVALMLLVAQLITVIVTQPLTTTFSHDYAIATVSLTCLGVLSQLLFVWAVDSLPLVDAAAACSLAVLGLSMLNMTLNAVQLVAAVRRRIVSLLKLRAEYATSLQLSSSKFEPSSSTDELLFPGDEIFDINVDEEAMELDAVMMMSGEGDEMSSPSGCDDDLFWNSEGAAFGTELVEGPSDIMLAEALQELPMEEEGYDRVSDADASEIVSFH
ncbi:GP46-like surface antigen, putative [Bodo saltans]|uniref:GP46-like surface antigen, putative n=1 Tax=Bodo saltans TaxID=75058 RepID=A0A0S4JU85_BODSA|nr:GP46-like surface antigen, putative [Bodo saltans]|eukprot:CUG92933.1 GP46-like surface antigen, putative [Bodo saltans]